MAQNITLLGASYSDVPSVELPKTGGGTAQFDDTTIASNAASASDITSGKLAFVNGELVTGTASGGGATLITKSITANGTYNASSDNADGYSSVTVNVSGGGGGLEYETGTWTPSTDVSDYTITFANTHSSAPFYYMICDMTGDFVAVSNSIIYMMFPTFENCFNDGVYNSASNKYYGRLQYMYASSGSGSSATGANIAQSTISSFFSTTGIRAYVNNSSRYWRAGRTYKWIAVWAPTS